MNNQTVKFFDSVDDLYLRMGACFSDCVKKFWDSIVGIFWSFGCACRCQACGGSGQVCAGYGQNFVTKYRSCYGCRGTGSSGKKCDNSSCRFK